MKLYFLWVVLRRALRETQNVTKRPRAWVNGTTRGLQKLQGIHSFCNHLCNLGCKKTARIMQRRLGSWDILWSESRSITCVLVPPQICNMGCKSGLTCLYLLEMQQYLQPWLHGHHTWWGTLPPAFGWRSRVFFAKSESWETSTYVLNAHVWV